MKFGRNNNSNVNAAAAPPQRQRGGMFSTLSSDLHAALLEFIGTFVFLFIGLVYVNWDTQAASKRPFIKPQYNTLNKESMEASCVQRSERWIFYGAASLGLSLLISVWLFYRVTGGIFNPNVSTALLLVGLIGPIRWILYCIAQLLGAIAASAVLLALLPGPLLFQTFPCPGINKPQAVFLEMFLTAMLILSVLMLGANRRLSTRFAPVGIGLTLFACELFGLGWTGGSLNTARSFEPAVVSGFHNTHWIYWVGPFLGTLLASALYHLLRRTRGWALNDDNDGVSNQGRHGYSNAPAGNYGGGVGRGVNATGATAGPTGNFDAGRTSNATTAIGRNDPINNV